MTKGNETAYPSPAFSEGGLTKREHIVIAAMQGLLSRQDSQKELLVSDVSRISEESIIMADALIKELNQKL